MKTCDLHCHSTCSDGTCTPEELVQLAIQFNIQVLALTDHNTVAGLPSFFKAANHKLEVVGGCEFTTCVGKQELHLLGLFFDLNQLEDIQSVLDQQLQRKEKSNYQTIENLRNAGYPLSYDEFISNYGTGVKNRVHIAKYLMEKNIVQSINEAFQDLLSVQSGYYQEVEKFDFFEMITYIQKIGGVSIWAHPLYHVDQKTCIDILKQAKTVGLDGVEVYYSTYSKEDTQFMKEVCIQFDLLESGGSDFHGENKPNLQMGIGYGNLCVPYSCYEILKERSNTRKGRM